MRVDQIGLLLWKNYIVRKRQPVIIRNENCWRFLEAKRRLKAHVHELRCLGHIGFGIRMARGRVHDPLHDSRQRGSEVLSNLPISCQVDAAEWPAPIRSEFHLQHRESLRPSVGIRGGPVLQKRHVSTGSSLYFLLISSFSSL